VTADTSRAMVLLAPRQFEEERYSLPEIGDDEFLLRVEMVTICGGDPIEYEGRNRKAHYPLILGHEMVGSVERIGPQAVARHGVTTGSRVSVEPYVSCGACRFCARGDYHFCEQGLVYGVTVPADRPPHLWGAFSEYLYGAPGAHLHLIDDQVPAEAACLTSVIGNAVRWIHTRGRARRGEGVLVLGAGVQALSSVIVAREAGVAPIVVVARARNPRKLELARTYGADVVIDADGNGLPDQIRGAFGGGSVELAIECTGAQSMIDLAIEALGPGGRLVQAGTRGGEPATVDLDGIVFKEIEFLGGLGQAGDTEAAARIVNGGRYAIEDMVTHRFGLSDAAEAMSLFMEGRDGVIHVALDPTA
jgi:threonine dehydrogenase-like Zn-dependent dehydrogenase